MSRAEISVGLLVTIISLMAFLAVSLVIVWPVMRDALFGAGEQQQCQLSLLFSYAKLQGTLGTITQDVPECAMKRMIVSMGTLDAVRSRAQSAVRQLNQPAEWPDSDYGYRKWALQEIIGKEMASCAERGLFSRVNFDPRSITSRQLSPTEMVCLLCTRLTFDEEVKGYFRSEIETTGLKMKPWLISNRINDLTYLDYVTTGTHPDLKVYTADTALKSTVPYTVLLVGDTIREGFGDYRLYNMVGLVPYENLLNNLEMGESGYTVFGVPFTGPRTCGVLIGD